jgi:chromosome partitioning protein
MAKTIAVVNQKGGVAKTTTAVSLGAALAMSEKNILIVDMDPQGNTSSGVGLDKYAAVGNTYHTLMGERTIDDVTLGTQLDFLKVVPSNKDLVGAELELVSEENREFRLKEAVNAVRDKYDYILIDSPPSLGLLTINAMVAADELLIPVQAEYYALEGVSELLDTMDRVKGAFNPELKINGFLLTMVDERTNLSSQVEQEVRNAFQGLVYKTTIPRNIRIAEAPSFGKPVILYDVNSKGSMAYLRLAKEFLANG